MTVRNSLIVSPSLSHIKFVSLGSWFIMYSDDLSNYIHSSNYDSFPTSVIDHCKLLILDTLGAMISASSSTYPISGILNNFTQSNLGPPESTIVGSSLKTSSINAALVNGT